MVVFSVLDVVPAHNLDLAKICILLPLRKDEGCGKKNIEKKHTYVEKVDLLEELLLVVLELPDHRRCRERRRSVAGASADAWRSTSERGSRPRSFPFAARTQHRLPSTPSSPRSVTCSSNVIMRSASEYTTMCSLRVSSLLSRKKLIRSFRLKAL